MIPTANHRWGFPCCIWSPGIHAVATTPAGLMGLIRSCFPINVGLPRRKGGSAPALPVSRPAQRLLTLRPARLPSRLRDPLHRRLQQICCLPCCFDCYRAERSSSRMGFAPVVDQRLSRRTFRCRLAVLRPLGVCRRLLLCHAGGRGFESHRSCKNSLAPTLRAATPGWMRKMVDWFNRSIEEEKHQAAPAQGRLRIC